MNKFKELKEAIKTTPPDRLAKIEYQSHFMQMLGVSAVCGILIFKGFWWIIFAFVFSLGVSFSQAVSAYQRYNTIINIIGKPKYNPNKDKSFTRSRNYIIETVYGKTMKWYSLSISVIVTLYLLPYDTWYFKILFGVGMIVVYVILYYHLIFFFADKLYSRKKK